MTTPNERLKEARLLAGFETAKEAAAAMGVAVSTYIGHENGHRGFPAKRAAGYARKFKVTEQWLLYGKGEGPTGSVVVEPLVSADEVQAMVETAMREVQPGMTFGEMTPVVASAIHEQLSRLLGPPELARISDARHARGKGAPSPSPTSKSGREGSRTA